MAKFIPYYNSYKHDHYFKLINFVSLIYKINLATFDKSYGRMPYRPVQLGTNLKPDEGPTAGQIEAVTYRIVLPRVRTCSSMNSAIQEKDVVSWNK